MEEKPDISTHHKRTKISPLINEQQRVVLQIQAIAADATPLETNNPNCLKCETFFICYEAIIVLDVLLSSRLSLNCRSRPFFVACSGVISESITGFAQIFTCGIKGESRSRTNTSGLPAGLASFL